MKLFLNKSFAGPLGIAQFGPNSIGFILITQRRIPERFIKITSFLTELSCLQGIWANSGMPGQVFAQIDPNSIGFALITQRTIPERFTKSYYF